MLRLKEANNILDRVERVEGIGQRNLHLHAHLTMEDIEELKRRALAAGVACGQVVDAEFSETDCNCTITGSDEPVLDNCGNAAVEGGDYGGGADS